MITLLHGDFIEASRNELMRLRTQYANREIRTLDGRNIDENVLVQSIESQSLFGGESIVIIDRLFSKLGRQQKRIDSLCAILSKSGNLDVILWEDKQITEATIRKLGSSVKHQLFALPKSIFQFLDGFRPNNAKHLIQLYRDTIRTNAPELVFSMLSKRVRVLIQVLDNETPEGQAGWQIQRLTSQAKYFTMEQLISLYQHMRDIDLSIKTGSSPLPLSARTEELLLRL